MASIVDTSKGLNLQTLREGAGGGSSGPCPFKIIQNLVNPSVLNVKIQPGTVNGILPANFAIGVDISSVGTYYIILRCNTSTGIVTNVNLIASTSPNSPLTTSLWSPPSQFEILIALIVNGTTYQVSSCKNYSAIAEESYKTEKLNPVVGLSPYDIYYAWKITS
jgi:hypothetical protein